MKKISFLLVLLFLNLKAISIQDAVALAHQNNPDIKSFDITSKSFYLDATKQSIWSNPVLGVGVNDIQFKKPFNRNLEPMQTQFITISQVIPTGGKLALKRDISLQDAKIQSLKKEELKRVLSAKIVELSYGYLIAQDKIAVIKKAVQNLKEQKKISTYLYESSKKDFLSILDIDTKLESLKLKLEDLLYTKQSLLLAIEKLSFVKIKDIKDSLKVKSIFIQQSKSINTHPTIKILKRMIDKTTLQTKLEIAKKTSDIKVGLGYFNRDGFDDYVSINFSMPLKLSKREDISIKQKKLQKKTLLIKLKSTKHQMQQDIKNLLLGLKRSRKNISLIDEKLLHINSQKEKIITVYEEQKSFGALKKLQNRYKRYELKLLKLKELEHFFKAYSRLSYYKENL